MPPRQTSSTGAEPARRGRGRLPTGQAGSATGNMSTASARNKSNDAAQRNRPSASARDGASPSSESEADKMVVSDDDNDGGNRRKGIRRGGNDDVEVEPEEVDDSDAEEVVEDEEEDNDEEEGQRRTIPPELLTRMLHEFFQRENTRITRDANAAMAMYMEVFVREAIARAAMERETGFLEVEDLEKVVAQLLLDL